MPFKASEKKLSGSTAPSSNFFAPIGAAEANAGNGTAQSATSSASSMLTSTAAGATASHSEHFEQHQQTVAPNDLNNEIFVDLAAEFVQFSMKIMLENSQTLDSVTQDMLKDLKYHLSDYSQKIKFVSQAAAEADYKTVIRPLILSKKPARVTIKTTQKKSIVNDSHNPQVIEEAEINTVEHPIAVALGNFVQDFDRKYNIPPPATEVDGQMVVYFSGRDVEAAKARGAIEERAKLAQQMLTMMPDLRRLMAPSQRQALLTLLGAEAAVSSVAQLLVNRTLSEEDAQDVLSSLLSPQRCQTIRALVRVIEGAGQDNLQALVAKRLIFNLIVLKDQSISDIFKKTTAQLLEVTENILQLPLDDVDHNTLKTLKGFSLFKAFWRDFVFSAETSPAMVNAQDECAAFRRLFQGEGCCLIADGTAVKYFVELAKKPAGTAWPRPLAYDQNFSDKLAQWKAQQLGHRVMPQ